MSWMHIKERGMFTWKTTLKKFKNYLKKKKVRKKGDI